MKRRCVLTGGTGFVGANLARRLLHDGHEVHLLVRRGARWWRLQGVLDQVRPHVVDFADEGALRQVAEEIRPDWVFHLATHGAYSYQNDLRTIIQTNVLGVINLVEVFAELGFEAFVNTGSSSEYGFKDHAPTEEEWLDPNSYYAVAKSSATLFCRYTAQARRLHIPTLRLYSVYGPYEEPTRLIPTLIEAGLAKCLPVLAAPDTARDYVYVDDVVDAYLLAAATPGLDRGAVYNVGSGRQTTLREVVDIAKRVLNISAEPAWGTMGSRSWDTDVWVADSALIDKQLGWKAAHSFENGFRATVAWRRQKREEPAWMS